MNLINEITKEYQKNDIPKFHVGDTVKVHIKIKEGARERIQIFEGFVLKKQNGGVSETFTVRRISSGVGVEKTFPLHSPRIEKIELVKEGEVRRAKLNYMRSRTGKSAKIRAKIYTEEQLAAEKAAIEAAKAEAEAKAKAKAEAEAKAAEEAAKAEAEAKVKEEADAAKEAEAAKAEAPTEVADEAKEAEAPEAEAEPKAEAEEAEAAEKTEE